jgi:cytochrome c-type biogenesis protein CcmE
MADFHPTNNSSNNSITDSITDKTKLDKPLPTSVSASQQAARRSRKTKKLMYGLAGIGVLMIAGLFIYQALNTSLVYFILPSEYATNPSLYDSRRIRLGGIVEEASVSFDDQALLLNFYITDSVERYSVQHYGTPPELFRENTGVVVEGGFQDGMFVSDNLLVKHTEVYEAPEDGKIDLDMLRESLE